MNKTMKQYKGKVLKAMMMLLAVGFALAGTSTLSSCSSDDDPYFTVSEDDAPRILNTDLADQKLNVGDPLKMEIKVTPVHYTTITWLLDDVQIAEGTSIDQEIPVGEHQLKIVATTTKGKTTSRTLKVTVVDPDVERTLWEGDFAVTWGTPFEALKETFLSQVSAGTKLRVYVDGSGQGTATTAWWNNILTGEADPNRGDIMVDGPATWEFVLTDKSIQLLTEQNGFLIVGDGYSVKKVTIE